MYLCKPVKVTDNNKDTSKFKVSVKSFIIQGPFAINFYGRNLIIFVIS